MNNRQSCILTLVILAVALCASILNHLYVEKVSTELLDAIDALPDRTDIASEQIESLGIVWDECRTLLDLTLPKPDIDKISLLIDETAIAALQGSEYDYKIATARLRRAVADIRDRERALFKNIC